MDNDKYLSEKKKDQTGQIVPKKKKGKELPQDLIINFKFDDYEPVSNKYQPAYKKQHGKIYYDNVDILDQSRFKFILNLNDEGGGNVNLTHHTEHSVNINNTMNKLSCKPASSSGNYTKYSHQLNSNLLWEEISAVIYYSNDVYTCPICLEKKLVVPSITRCGHIFCWPCLFNYYDYWTKSSTNKKIPQCPLCKEKINLVQVKFCDIYQCVNYVSSLDMSSNEKEREDKYHTHFISFNLIMKNKKAPTLYNTFYDPDLEYYKKNLDQKDAFNFIPLENREEFSFGRIFLTNQQLIMKKYNSIKNELEEALKDELSLYADERKVASLNMCLDNIVNKIKVIKNKKNAKDEEEEEESENIEEIGEIIGENINENIPLTNEETSPVHLTNTGNLTEKSNLSETINENFSTLDEDPQKADLKLKDFLYFYQEQFGDIYFLHPINYSILISEYGTEEQLPTEVSGRILEIEMHQITPFIKNKYPFLNHLKIGSMFFLVEIDMKQLVSNHTLKQFHNVLKDRAKIRNSIKREEDYYNSYVQNLKSKEEKQISADLLVNSRQFKIKEYFKEENDNLSLNDEGDINHNNVEATETSNSSVQEKDNLNTINEKKENKLKLLLENKIISTQPEKAKKSSGPKFCFTAEDFPDITGSTDAPKIMKNNEYVSDNEGLYNESDVGLGVQNTLDYADKNIHENSLHDEGFTIVKPKQGNKISNKTKNAKKKKKFAEINFDLIKEIEGKQLDQIDQSEQVGTTEENTLKQNLTATTNKNKKKTTTVLTNKKGISTKKK